MIPLGRQKRFLSSQLGRAGSLQAYSIERQWWAEKSMALTRANKEATLASLGDQFAGEGLDESGDQDDPGLGGQPVDTALLPTEG